MSATIRSILEDLAATIHHSQSVDPEVSSEAKDEAYRYYMQNGMDKTLERLYLTWSRAWKSAATCMTT